MADALTLSLSKGQAGCARLGLRQAQPERITCQNDCSFGPAVWRAALARVGTPFRFHGHDPATGLDCVGLVVAAHRGAGVEPVVLPVAYRVRDMDVGAVAAMLGAAGLVAVEDVAVGDVELCAVGHGQVHLVICGAGAFVHAHAGLRRVVLMPGEPGGVVGRWRWAACPLRCD